MSWFSRFKSIEARKGENAQQTERSVNRIITALTRSHYKEQEEVKALTKMIQETQAKGAQVHRMIENEDEEGKKLKDAERRDITTAEGVRQQERLVYNRKLGNNRLYHQVYEENNGLRQTYLRLVKTDEITRQDIVVRVRRIKDDFLKLEKLDPLNFSQLKNDAKARIHELRGLLEQKMALSKERVNAIRRVQGLQESDKKIEEQNVIYLKQEGAIANNIRKAEKEEIKGDKNAKIIKGNFGMNKLNEGIRRVA